MLSSMASTTVEPLFDVSVPPSTKTSDSVGKVILCLLKSTSRFFAGRIGAGGGQRATQPIDE